MLCVYKAARKVLWELLMSFKFTVPLTTTFKVCSHFKFGSVVLEYWLPVMFFSRKPRVQAIGRCILLALPRRILDDYNHR